MIGKMEERETLERIGREMKLSGNNKISVKENGFSILTAVSIADIQAVIDFMYGEGRARLRGLKKVKFLA